MSQRKNYHTVRYGTRDGELQFGHIHKDNNESAVMLRSGHDFIHYISMDSTGNEVRKHGTICRSPGSFQVKAGDNAKVTDDNRNNAYDTNDDKYKRIKRIIHDPVVTEDTDP